MFLVRYTLHTGETRHYAPSAMAAVRLIRDIDESGGNVLSIMRTRDHVVLTRDQLARISESDVGPADERMFSFAAAVKRLMRLDPGS